MRAARIKPLAATAEGTYFHLVNRTAGHPGDFPFGEIEKEKFIRSLLDQAAFFTVEVLAFMVMGNHFHLLLFAPATAPTPEEAIRRFIAHYGDKKVPPALGTPACVELAARLRDISAFMHDLQGPFATWFNGRGKLKRRGGLWADRFKSVVIEGVSSVWECLKYIVMNPVRAKIVADPADYRFGSWGAWCGTGIHPFAANLLHHLRRTCGAHTAAWTLDDFGRELRKEFARVQVGEAGGTTDQIEQAVAAAAPEPPKLTVLTRRVRYWTDGLVIGSKEFLQATMGLFQPPERMERHRISPPTTLAGAGVHAHPLKIHSWRRPRESFPG